MLKKMTNADIYFIYQKINEALNNSNQYLPAKASFYIQKNKNKIAELALEIEQTRAQIVKNFGKPSTEEEGKYFIPKENMEIAQKELNDLLNIEQEIDINIISLEDIQNLHFTIPQMEALMFMIEE